MRVFVAILQAMAGNELDEFLELVGVQEVRLQPPREERPSSCSAAVSGRRRRLAERDASVVADQQQDVDAEEVLELVAVGDQGAQAAVDNHNLVWMAITRSKKTVKRFSSRVMEVSARSAGFEQQWVTVAAEFVVFVRCEL